LNVAADNVCFFDSDYDQEKLFECARLAGIHDEIMAMPMTYNSLVGDSRRMRRIGSSEFGERELRPAGAAGMARAQEHLAAHGSLHRARL
jgi:hypothetical protein